MPEITITEAQLEYLEDLREYIAEEHVGPYGYVRMREAVQFLIDRYETSESAEREIARRIVRNQLEEYSYQELQSLAAETEGVEAGGKADELRERLVDARVENIWAEMSAEGEDGEPIVNPEVGDSTADSDNTDDDALSATDGTDGDSIDNEADNESTDRASSQNSADGSRLQRMMGLLEEYTEQWTESDSDEGKYAVTLPDGSVEHVRTKDDVRALLFRHYD